MAFSRDHTDKRYVQHIVHEQRDRLAAMLNAGAHIYVCGSIAMGHAVTDVLRSDHLDALEEAEESGRLHRDLY